MKQNDSALRGTKKVFVFTFVQFAKNKANLITLIFLLILSLASVPVMTLLSGGEIDMGEQPGVDAVYLQNQTELPLAAEDLAGRDPYFENTKFLDAAEGSRPTLQDDQLLITVSEQENSYQVEVTRATDLVLTENDLSRAEDLAAAAVRSSQLKGFGLSEEQAKTAVGPLQTSVGSISDYRQDQGPSWEVQYGVQLFYSIVVIIVSIFSVTYIIRTVVEEKASKLVELLMVSVKPLALIVGKILAAMAYVFGTFVLLLLGFGVSYFVSGFFMDVSDFGSAISGVDLSSGFLNLGVDTVLVVLISLILGYLTFSIIAGLSGTGCSSTDDIQSAATLSTLLIMAGYMASIFISTMGGGGAGITVFSSLCPILSVFCAPVNYMTGAIPFWMLLVSWLIQAAVVALLALFCAKIYSSLLLYRGSRVKLGQMLSMAKHASSKKEVG